MDKGKVVVIQFVTSAETVGEAILARYERP